jgi:outer membrane porin, OprD family
MQALLEILGIDPGRRTVVALSLALVSLIPAVAVAQTPAAPGQAAQETAVQQDVSSVRGEDVTVRSPDSAPQPPPQTGLLDYLFPKWPEARKTHPPFFRDTDLNVRLRTFYFNRQNDNDTVSEALATGGWIQYASGWLFDTFAIGSTFYTSLPLHAPDDHPGSLLLTPGQGSIGVFGEAWAALRYKEYALLKGYRQKIDDGYVNPQDNRMVPNTFEALMLSGTFEWLRYDVGYLWNIKPRDSNDFISMSEQAGAPGDDKGLVLTSLTLTPIKDLALYGGNFYAPDVFNTLFVKGEYTLPISKDLKMQFGLQFTDQRGVGDERLGDFTTWNVGAGARVLWRGLSVGVATHFTGDDASIRSPWGSWPGYLSLMVTDFDRANEKAFGIGVKYDFGGTLLPFQLPGLTLQMIYGQGNDRIDPTSGAAQPNTYEGNLDITYNVQAVKGLSLRFRNAYVGRGNDEIVKDFRFIVNYELNLL